MGGIPIRFTPLYGVHGGQPLSYLLELGDFVILLDCGWDDRYDPALLRPLHDVLDHIDLVLLSHPDPSHLGALPFLVGRLGLGAPIYGTGPVHKMGQMFMYDQYLCRQATSNFDAFNLDDVDAAFSPSRFTALRYQQNTTLTGKGAGITLTPFAAGHLLGGTLWRISRDGDDFVYAVDYNHRKERHLNGTVLESAFCRPALLITDAWNALNMAPDRATKDKEFLDVILNTLRSDGSVLIPADCAGRVLELLLLLENAWAEGRYTYPLALLSPMASNMLEFAKSQVEWMNQALTRSLGHTRDNPFNTRFLKIVTSLQELSRLPQGPKVVLATLPSLEAGPSRHLFSEWATEPNNAIIFCTAPEEGTLGERVLQLSQQTKHAPHTITLTLSRRVPLEGEELQDYLAAQQAQQELSEAQAAALGSEASLGLGSPLAGSSPRVGGGPRATRSHSGTIARLRRVSGSVTGAVAEPDGAPRVAQSNADASACLIEGFAVPQGAAGPMFPFDNAWEGVVYDEYGAAIDPADFDLTEHSMGVKAMEAELEVEEDTPAAAAPPDVPTKIVSEEKQVTLRARVLRFDYDGRSDGRSMRTMLTHVAPRRTILVHGTTQATTALQGYLQQELSSLQGEVYAPRAGESVDIAAEPSYRVGLSEEVMTGLRFHAMGTYHLAWVNARMAEAAAAAEGGGEVVVGALLPASAVGGEEGAAGAYGGVFIGDVRLSEVKKALAEVGVAAEFHSGTLYCAGGVAVRRQGEEGGLLVEGPLSEDYYRVRDVVYGQYNVC